MVGEVAASGAATTIKHVTKVAALTMNSRVTMEQHTRVAEVIMAYGTRHRNEAMKPLLTDLTT